MDKWNHIKTGIKEALKVKNKNITVEDSEIEVKGSPDVELFQKAYNQMYSNENFEVKGDNTSGWQYRFGKTGDFVTSILVSNYSSKTLFFIGEHYWLASPSTYYENVCNILSTGQFFCKSFKSGNSGGSRPVVSIPKTAFDQLVS